MKFDATDKKLIELLQTDSKQTTKQLSLQLNLSVTAVYERIKKLEREKVISSYAAIIDKEQIGRGFVVFCSIKLVKHTQDYVVNFEKDISQLKEVTECYHISGDYDYLLKVLVADMIEFRKFMVEKLTTISHIGSTQSAFMINEVKHTHVISF